MTIMTMIFYFLGRKRIDNKIYGIYRHNCHNRHRTIQIKRGRGGAFRGASSLKNITNYNIIGKRGIVAKCGIIENHRICGKTWYL
jgi:hypothetical protein